MDAPLRIDGHVVRDRIDHAGRAQCRKRRALSHDARAHRRGGVVRRAAHDRRALAQARLLCGARVHAACHIGRFVDRREQRAVDRKALQHLAGPATARHIHELHARGVGDLGRPFARQPVADVILRQQDMPASGVQCGLVLLHPEDFGRGKARHRRVRRNLDEALLADEPLHALRLRARALIAPEDRRTQHMPRIVQHHQAVHLAREADGYDVLCSHARPRDDSPGSLAYRPVPILGVLLRPAVMRLAHFIFDRVARRRTACLVEKHRLQSGGSKIDA